MIVLDFVQQQIPGGWRKTPSGWTSGNCPMCTSHGHSADTRKRGGFMFADDKFQYNCFNCGFKTGWSDGRKINGRLQELLVALGADPAQIQRVNFELLKAQDDKNIASQFITKEETSNVVVDWTTVELPDESMLLHLVDTASLSERNLKKFISAVEYIHHRGLDFYDKWYWSPHSHFANRVILPFYYKNKIVGYTARFVGTPPDKKIPKYYLQSPSNYVYNLDAQRDNKYVIVTEGQFDALFVGGVAMAGNTPSPTQCSLVDQLKKEVILLPDADKAGMDMIKAAITHGWNVSFPDWDDEIKDAADAVEKYGRLFTVRSILESVETNGTKIQVMAKKYCKD
tara:strand:+ start:483 stop:1505 length:1023 start_codon:yes stop_codon:yes gene_type:complete